MNLFRSEEHVLRWLGDREPGATIPIQTICDLGYTWYDPEFPTRSLDEYQALLTSHELTSDFWRL